jgi:hypothetical protein
MDISYAAWNRERLADVVIPEGRGRKASRTVKIPLHPTSGVPGRALCHQMI